MTQDETTQATTVITRVTPVIAGYEIVRRLHQGGQGVVYEAVQKSTKRKVAIKMLLGGAAASKAARKRFEREIDVVAQLKHPNIITIFDSGETPDAEMYCVMDYVRGYTLREYVQQNHLPLEDTLRLFVTVCEAVQYAHQKGVIHRDIKPSNILVNAEGQPRILDFGLAKPLLDAVDTVVTMSQDLLGTLPYMSPEQVKGNPDEIDTRTDVYALGVVLYELLTGRYPYPVLGNMAEVLQNIVETPPSPPSNMWSADTGVSSRSAGRPGVCPLDDDLETIVLKALAKERSRRYQSAGELARDIEHYLAGELIEARRDSSWYLLRRLMRRNARRLAVAGLMIVLVATAAVMVARERRATKTADTLAHARLLSDVRWDINHGDYAAALERTADATANSEDDLDLLLLQATARLHLGDRGEAERLLLRVKDLYPDVPAVWYLLAQVAGKEDKARADHYIAKAAAAGEDSTRDLYLRALVCQDNDRAVEFLDEAIRRDPNYFEALMTRCARLYDIGRYQEARIDAERARTLRPEDPGAWKNLGVCLFRLGDDRSAEAALRKALQLEPEYAGSWLNLAMALQRQRHYEQAEQAYERAIELNDGLAEAWCGLGRVRTNRGQLEPARAAFREALSRRPDYAAALYGLAYASYLAGDEHEALANYDRFLERQPTHAYALNDAAWLRLTAEDQTLRDEEQALKLAKRAVEAEPQQAAFLSTLALAELRNNLPGDARRHALGGIDLDAQDPWCRALACAAAFELGLTKDGCTRWRDIRLEGSDENEDAALSAFLMDIEATAAGACDDFPIQDKTQESDE